MVSETSRASYSEPVIQREVHFNLSAFLVISLLISSVGPYVSANLRVDQILLLVSSGASIFVFASRQAKYSIIWVAVMFAALLGALLPIVNDLIWPPLYRVTSAISVVWRLLAPVLLLFVFGVLMNKNNKLYDRVLKNIWILGLFNVCIALMTLEYVPKWLQFYATGGGAGSVWGSSLAVYRFIGVFGQPLEIGVFYSLILINSVYLWCNNRINLWQFAISTIVCLVGGGLSLSKNFLVLGVTSAIFLAIYLDRKKGVKFFFFIFIIIIIAIVNISFWVNMSMITAYTDLVDKNNLLMALTAGRFGSGDTEVMLLFKSVIKDGLFTGKGLGTFLPLDNGYLEYFYQGGIAALLFYLLLHCFLIIGAWRFRQTKTGIMLFVLAIYSLFASLGGPVITANRANILFFFIGVYYLNKASLEKYGVNFKINN